MERSHTPVAAAPLDEPAVELDSTRSVLRDDAARWRLIFAGIILLGAVLRIIQYAWRSSYWHDEAWLVLNIFDKPAADLFGPLNDDQAAPPLLLLALRGMYLVFGRDEYAMRLIPLLLSIAALVLFALIARRTLAPVIAAVVVAMFAVSNNLIMHAAEAKQYSGDVLAAALLALVALPNGADRSASRRLVDVSLLATALLWFSYPVVFVFGGIALALLPRVLRERPRRHAALLASALPVVSFFVLYLLVIRDQQSPALYEYWIRKFVDFSRPLAIPWWLVRSFISLLGYAYDMAGPVLLPLGVLGAIHLWKTGRRDVLGVLVLPMLLTLVAAVLHRYPFGGTRGTVFLAPACLLLAGAGLDALRERRDRLPHVWVILAVGLIALNGVIAVYHVAVPRYRSNMRAVLEYIHEHRPPHEHLYVPRGEELLTYWPNPDARVHLGPLPESIPHDRFWIAQTFGSARREEVEIEETERFGTPAMEHRIRGGAVLRFERSIAR